MIIVINLLFLSHSLSLCACERSNDVLAASYLAYPDGSIEENRWKQIVQEFGLQPATERRYTARTGDRSKVVHNEQP